MQVRYQAALRPDCLTGWSGLQAPDKARNDTRLKRSAEPQRFNNCSSSSSSMRIWRTI